MYKNVMLAMLIVFIGFGCRSTPSPKTPLRTTADTTVAIEGALKLSETSFAASLPKGKYQEQCKMLTTLEASILASAQKLGVPIHVDSAVATKDHEIRVSYVAIESHKWRFMAIRPSSSATIEVEIIQEGQVLRAVTKTISSAVAFGACDRLEKIATANGRFVAKWVAQQL